MTRVMLALALMASAAPVAVADEAPNCKKCGNQEYGTSVQWSGSPSDAATKAKKEEKLVFILHVSGYFEDPKFT